MPCAHGGPSVGAMTSDTHPLTPDGTGHGRAHTRHRGDHDGPGAQAELLDLETRVLAGNTAALVRWLPLQEPPRRVVDLGCGTGAGTFALLRHLPGAHVTAVDGSAEHLHRLRERAGALGAAERVRTVRADLDAEPWPALGTPNLVWASASMHHLADPDRALRAVHETLAPGGLFALVEVAGSPRFLPASAPESRPGLEERCHAASERRHAHRLPHRGADWGAKLARAGFTVEGERTFTVAVDAARDAEAGAYALGSLGRMREAVADALAPEDLAALDELLDAGGPGGILHRDDLAVRTERTVWAARRTG